MNNFELNVKLGISSLIFRIYAGALYNELFLKKEVKFTRFKIDIMEMRLKFVLSYFSPWYNCRNSRKSHPDENIRKMWEKSVLSSTTHYVMHLGAISFLDYCNYILRQYTEVHSVPALHSNTLSLELLFFSLIQWHHANNPSKYETTSNIIDNKKSMDLLKKNHKYEGYKEAYVKQKALQVVILKQGGSWLQKMN